MPKVSNKSSTKAARRSEQAITLDDPAKNRERLAQQFLDAEGAIRDLCRAVKVISSVVEDQLSHPMGGPPQTSDFGLEVQTFYIDAEMLRYAVDHAAQLALAVRDKTQ